MVLRSLVECLCRAYKVRAQKLSERGPQIAANFDYKTTVKKLIKITESC